MRENTTRKNSAFGDFSGSVNTHLSYVVIFVVFILFTAKKENFYCEKNLYLYSTYKKAHNGPFTVS